MTIVGKILVLVNLVFSLVVGGLVMMVYMTRTNWEEAYKKKDAQYVGIDADRKQLEVDFKAAETKLNADVQALQKQVQDKDTILQAVKDELDATKKQFAAIKDKDREGVANTTVLQDVSTARKDQVKELEKSNGELRQKTLDLINEKNEERRARIQSDVEAKTVKARNLDLKAQVRDLGRELIRSKASPTGAVVVRKRGDENPPPDNVEGRVRQVDPEEGLITLSIGSDAGLAQGHTLKVFRLHPIPEQSKYLGTIEILMVRPHEAVGRPVSRTAFPIRPGDRVASRLLVGSN